MTTNEQPRTFVRMAEPGECSYCDQAREKGDKMMPYHTASSRCQSGGHNHCTCDRCY